MAGSSHRTLNADPRVLGEPTLLPVQSVLAQLCVSVRGMSCHHGSQRERDAREFATGPRGQNLQKSTARAWAATLTSLGVAGHSVRTSKTAGVNERQVCGGCGSVMGPPISLHQVTVGFKADAYFASSSRKLSTDLATCETCGLTQVCVLPGRSALQAAYADAADDDHSQQFGHRRSSFARALQRSVFPFIPPAQRSPWLDVGTAGGAFVAAARAFDVDAIGIEPSAYVVSRAPSELHAYLRSGFIDGLDAEERFQVISYWDVLEHVADPRAEILAAKKHLVPAGFLVLNLPMIDTPSARLLGRSAWPFYLDVHLYYFTRRTVERFLTPLGFEVIAVNSYAQTLDLRYILGRFMRGRPLAAVLSRIPIRYRMGQRTVVARLVS